MRRLAPRKRKPHRRWTRQLLFYVGACVITLYTAIALSLLLLRFVAPPTTAVQVERRINAWREGRPYRKQYSFVPLNQVSPYLPHALIAAEDTRFYEHHGFDWKEVGAAIRQDVEHGRRRGASTITQQLVRNLFLNTNPSLLRKTFEFSIVPLTELILSKDRILELYLNVVEWGPGIYGADAASEVYFHRPALRLDRDQAIELASVLPAPLHRKPGKPEWYAKRIRERMWQMNW